MIDAFINRLKELNDPLLDDWTLALIRHVYEDARQGYTMAQLMGYVAYRKRGANKADKEKCRTVLSALKNNRWGIRDDVEALQQQAKAERESEARSREARAVWRMQQRETRALIPESKRGRGTKGRNRGGYVAKLARQSEASAELVILRHNERVQREKAMRRATSE